MGAKVTLSNVNIETTSNAAVSVSGNVELIIAGTNTNTLRSGTDHAGVEKADDNGTLTISGPGKLNAYGGQAAQALAAHGIKMPAILLLKVVRSRPTAVTGVQALAEVKARRVKILRFAMVM